MDFSTGNEPSREPDPGNSSGEMGDSGPEMSGGSGNEEFNFSDPVQSFVAATKGVLLKPTGFFQSIRHQGDWINPILFALIWYMLAAIVGALISLVFGSLSSIGSGGAGDQAAGIAASFGGFIFAIIIAPIVAAAILLVMAGLRHLLIMLIVGSQNAGFEATLRVQAYTFATRIVWWIPVLGTIVGFFYGIYLSIVGIREVHATTTGKAAMVVLIPVAVVLVILALLVALIGAAVYTLVQQQM